MSGELEPKRLAGGEMDTIDARDRECAKLGGGLFAIKSKWPPTVEHVEAVQDRRALLQHIAWQEAELQRARLAVELAEAAIAHEDAQRAWRFTPSAEIVGERYDSLYDDMRRTSVVETFARDAYRAAKAAAHGPTKPPTDLQGG